MIHEKTRSKKSCDTVPSTVLYVQALCNNAGIFHDTDWKRVQEINLDGMVTGTMLAMEKMGVRDRGGGIGMEVGG